MDAEKVVKRPLRRDLLTTLAAQATACVCGLLVYRLAASLFGPDDFSKYAVTRRAISLLQPALNMGLGVGVARYVAQSSAAGDEEQADTYFVAALFVQTVALICVAASLNLAVGPISRLIYGSIDGHALVPALSLVLVGLSLHSVCYSYFRGHIAVRSSNLLVVANVALVPMIGIELGRGVERALLWTGGLTSLLSVCVMFFIIKGLRWPPVNVYRCAQRLLQYGIPRLFGDLGLAGLLAAPSLVAVHLYDLRLAGYLALATSILGLFGASLAPVGIVLLPRLMHLIVRQDVDYLRSFIRKTLVVQMLVSIPSTVVVLASAPLLIRLYLGPAYVDAAGIIRIVAIAFVPYGAYLAMRSVLDSVYVTALNSRNIAISLAVFGSLVGIVAKLSLSVDWLAGAMTASLTCLGGLTILETEKIVSGRAVLDSPSTAAVSETS